MERSLQKENPGAMPKTPGKSGGDRFDLESELQAYAEDLRRAVDFLKAPGRTAACILTIRLEFRF